MGKSSGNCRDKDALTERGLDGLCLLASGLREAVALKGNRNSGSAGARAPRLAHVTPDSAVLRARSRPQPGQRARDSRRPPSPRCVPACAHPAGGERAHAQRAAAPPRARPPSLPPSPGRRVPPWRVSPRVPSLPGRARAAAALPALQPPCRSHPLPEEEVEEPQGPAEAAAAARWRTSCRRAPCCPCASRAAC